MKYRIMAVIGVTWPIGYAWGALGPHMALAYLCMLGGSAWLGWLAAEEWMKSKKGS